MIIVVMGVAGSGKTLIGGLLAADLGCPFLDADDFHSAQSVAKMRGGTPLTDDDRNEWLERLSATIADFAARGGSAVLACSALKRAFRARLRAAAPHVHFVYLKGSLGTIDARLRRRRGHYFPPELLASQFAALEEPDDAIVVSVEAQPEAIVRAIRAALRRA